MKICYLSDANSYHTKKWCKYFTQRGHEVHVISFNPGEIDNVHVHDLNLSLQDIRGKGNLYKVKYVFKLSEVKKLVKKIRPDILHAHYASSYGLIGALCNYHPYVISVWGSDVYDFPKNQIFKSIIKNNLKKADRILSTSKVMAVETQKYTNEDIEITPFGVDLNVFKPLDNFNKNKETFTIGTIKALEAKYGIEDLIRAFSIVRSKYSNVRLEIAGRGSQEDYLKELIKELEIESDVEFLGFLSVDEVVKAFNRFDVSVFPSTLDSESFGVAAVEAQACGIPVIVSNVGGLPEATSPGVSSILINKNSYRELSEAIIKLIEDENLRKTMAINARKYVEDNFNIEDNFRKVEGIYNKLLRK